MSSLAAKQQQVATGRACRIVKSVCSPCIQRAASSVQRQQQRTSASASASARRCAAAPLADVQQQQQLDAATFLARGYLLSQQQDHQQQQQQYLSQQQHLSQQHEPAAAIRAAGLAAAVGLGAALLALTPAAAHAAPDLNPASGDLAEGQEFWGNVARYGRYFVTVMLGTGYVMVRPLLGLFKNPLTGALAVVAIGGAAYGVKVTLEAMLGISEPFDYLPPTSVGF